MTRTRVLVPAVVFFVLSVCSGLLATERHVAPAPLGNDGNPGTNELPFATIQRGIDAASDGDTVIVGQGTYVENIRFNGNNIVLRSTDPLNPTIVANTIIDGNQANSVVTFSGTETEACILSGFTIRNGKAQQVGAYQAGGGIRGGRDPDNCTHATIQNNAITDNSATSYGGGLSFCGGTIQNNTITGNSATHQYGGGFYYCNGTIRNNTISGNAGGGLLWCDGTIQNNTITGNSAEYGGGLSNCDGTIQNNTIAGNSGGGLEDCDGTIQNNTITGNSAGSYGGGLWACDGTIQNNTITGNSAYAGGGLYNCDGTIQNNTIAGNSADSGGGLSWCHGTIRNCIIWGNTAPTGPQLQYSSTPTYSCIEGWTDGGEGNITSNPRFVNTKAHDYHLQAGSPCIDAGINEDWMWSATDLDGNPRIVHGGLSLTVDMGAYEYRPFRISQILVEASGGLQLTWNSSPNILVYIIWSCTDLSSAVWTQEQTVPSAGDSTSWTDPSPGGSRKFYRVQLE